MFCDDEEEERDAAAAVREVERGEGTQRGVVKAKCWVEGAEGETLRGEESVGEPEIERRGRE